MKTSTQQLNHLLRFEFLHFARRKWTFLVPLFFAAFGIFAGTNAGAFPMENTFKNGTFSITYLLGWMSLMCIFTSTIVAAQVLFREKDARFSLLLYATLINKKNYLWSRFLMVFGITAITFFLFTLAFALGQFISIKDNGEFGVFHLWFYIHTFLLIALPNILFCSTVICVFGWFSQNKLLIYVSGLFIYILYMATLLFSSSPLMGGGFPASPEAIDISAKFDPFGLSAFFQQTLQWTAFQRNNQLISLTGNMLFNRLFFTAVSFGMLGFLFYRFQFSFGEKGSQGSKLKDKLSSLFTLVSFNLFKNKTPRTSPYPLQRRTSTNGKSPFEGGGGMSFGSKTQTTPNTSNPKYHLQSTLSFLKLDLKFILKSIPFVLIIIGLGFILSMEIYAEIEKGIRLPQKYASTELMINTILETFPIICILVLLFYGNELIWRSKDSNFCLMEDSTPVTPFIKIISKWLSLVNIVAILLIWTIIISVIFQISYQYYYFNFTAYLSLFYVIGAPLLLTCGLIVSIQYLFENKYVSLVISTVIVFLINSNLGKNFGLTHPLFRFARTFTSEISGMNGFGGYLYAFHWKMFFGVCITLLLFFVVVKYRQNVKISLLFNTPFQLISAFLLFSGSVFSGINIHNQLEIEDKNAMLDWQQNYEKKYRKFQNFAQPIITEIKANIDLFPEKNSYKVSAIYTLQNKTGKPIEKLLFYATNEVRLKKITVKNTEDSVFDKAFGQYWFTLSKPLQPNETIKTEIEFDYTWNSFTKHTPFNSIVENGSFMRISNYFPSLGYNSDIEISDKEERKNRKLGKETDVLSLNAPRNIQSDFINLEAIISTSNHQTAIGVGELVGTWVKDGRNFFHYKTTSLIPPRFAVSSAKYVVEKQKYRGILIEVFYHPNHHENVNNLMENAKNTLDYCEQNFGKYPFKTIRFAEISSFSKGFAATAYPATIYMAEDVIFHANIKADKQQDVINELAGHELSHEWWGANQLSPDEREGAKLLTETLAMYTELMLVKKMYGAERVLENVRMHEGIYLSERGLRDEQPLIKTLIENTHQHYSKGLVVMYQISELIGEEKINLALRSLFKKYANSAISPISTDLIDEIYAVTEPKFHPKIDELFKRITTFDVEIVKKSVLKMTDKYDVNIEAIIHKYDEDGKGSKRKMVMNDIVEIVFYFKNDTQKRMVIPVKNNRISYQTFFGEKPLKVIIDPEEKLLKLSSDNEAKF
jgi:ABC-2 type transport system permease protein